MKKKKIIGIILAAALVAAGLGGFAYAQGGSVNEVDARFHTDWTYWSLEDTFTNSEVSGTRAWSALVDNRPDETHEPVNEVTLTLDSKLEFDWVEPEPTTVTPLGYQWSLGNVDEGSWAGALVGFDIPDPSPVTFTPGFDASRSADKTEFAEAGTQTLTITVTPREVTEGLSIPVGVNADENDLVNPVITAVTNGDEFEFDLSPDGHRLHLWLGSPELNRTYTFYVTIKVTPKVPKVEFMPFVGVGCFQDLASGTTSGSFVSRPAGAPLDEVGTWTMSAEGSYVWHWGEGLHRSVIWHPCSREIPVIEDFTIKDMVIDFDRPSHDKIDIKKATFRLPEGATYDLAVDDVTVTVDGVVITIPAGSFVQGKGGDYIFKTPRGVEPKVDMKLNFDKGEWSFKVDKIDASAVDNADGVDLTLSIGSMSASEHINMWVDRLSYPPKVYNIGVTQILTHPDLDATRQGFIDQMAEEGFVEGVNVKYDFRNPEDDLTEAEGIAEAFVSEKVDLILSITTPSSQACVEAAEGTGIPVVFAAVTDPVGAEIVSKWDAPRPDNVTGVSDFPDIKAQMELIKEILPGATVLGVIYNPAEFNSVLQIEKLEAIKAEVGIVDIVEAEVATPGDVYDAAMSLVGRCDAIWIPEENTAVSGLEAVIVVGEENQIPVFGSAVTTVERGCIATEGVDYTWEGEQAGRYAARILRGKFAGNIPVVKCSGEALVLVVNPAAAERMGVEIPDSVLQRADRIVGEEP